MCGCHDLIQLFAERIYDWHGLRANRPNVMQVNTRCQKCGREWALIFQAIPAHHPLVKDRRIIPDRRHPTES